MGKFKRGGEGEDVVHVFISTAMAGWGSFSRPVDPLTRVREHCQARRATGSQLRTVLFQAALATLIPMGSRNPQDSQDQAACQASTDREPSMSYPRCR